MFDNIGDKLKSLAIIYTVVGMIISGISGIISMSESFIAGLLIIALGSLGSWVSSFAIYGLGEIIEQLEISNNNTFQLHKLLSKLVPEEDKKPEPEKSYSLSQLAKEKTTSTPQVNDLWYCKECNTTNDSKSLYCKNCGEYR